MSKNTIPPKKNVRLFDVACRLLFVAAVDESLLEHGSGFLMHVLEQEALRLLKEGKRPRDFHLSVTEAVALKRQPSLETAAETEALLHRFMQYLADGEAGTNLVAQGSDINRQIVANFLARRSIPVSGEPSTQEPAPEIEGE